MHKSRVACGEKATAEINFMGSINVHAPPEKIKQKATFMKGRTEREQKEASS